MAVNGIRGMILAGSVFCGLGAAQKGMVVDDATGKPIAKALVMQKPGWDMVLTDEKGIFEFDAANALPPAHARRGLNRIRISPDGAICLSPPLRPGAATLQLITPLGQSFALPLSPEGTARIPAHIGPDQILFLRVGALTYRLVG